MGLDMYAYLVVGLPLAKADMYQSMICCERCHKQYPTNFCPDCGQKIKEIEVMKPMFEKLDEKYLQTTSCEGGDWYLVLKKFSTRSNRNGMAFVAISLQDFIISSQEMQDFEALAHRLGVWDKTKFGVYLFQYASY